MPHGGASDGPRVSRWVKKSLWLGGLGAVLFFAVGGFALRACRTAGLTASEVEGRWSLSGRRQWLEPDPFTFATGRAEGRGRRVFCIRGSPSPSLRTFPPPNPCRLEQRSACLRRPAAECEERRRRSEEPSRPGDEGGGKQMAELMELASCQLRHFVTRLAHGKLFRLPICPPPPHWEVGPNFERRRCLPISSPY